MVELKSAILAIVTIVVILILASAIVPGAMDTISGVNATTNPTWSAGALSMWGVIGLFAVLAILLLFVGIAIKAVD